METDTPVRSAAGTGNGVHERILETATELFYAGGIRGTSADRIIERVGITKVTFYRHFRTKDDLVVAYLERVAAFERAGMTVTDPDADPVESLRAIASGIAAGTCRPGFRGCAFINAAAEYPDPDHPVRQVVDTHRRWISDLFAGLAAVAGVADPEVAARQLLMLRDGAMVGGALGDPATVGPALAAACAAVISSARG